MKTLLIKCQILLLAIILASCNGVKNNKASTDATQLNGSWTLSTINGNQFDANMLMKKPNLQLNIPENRASGNDGCNQFSGAIDTLEDNKLTFSTFAGTKMACPNMELSQQINNALSEVVTFKIEDSKLLLFNANNTEVLRYTKENKDMAVAHNSSNALDWFGTYKGTMPCADCEGIATELVLNQDKTYQLKSIYLGKDNNAFNETGTFNWNEKGNGITLNVDGKTSVNHQFQVMENKLVKLDNTGNVITGALADKYVLNKSMAMSQELKDGEYFYWVHSKRAECTGVGKQSCLQIQRGETLQPNGWQLFYSSIKGFTFEPGYTYKLIVKEEQRPANQVPADASSINYSLIKVLDKTMDKTLRLHDIWALQAVKGETINPKDYNQHPNLELNLRTNRVMGSDGCNTFSGDIKTADTKNLTFKALISTEKACLNMKLTNQVGKYLSEVQTYKLNNLELTLFNTEGDEVLRYKKVD
ncbi:META domain-containing protein [Lacinutrix chionoecetis]